MSELATKQTFEEKMRNRIREGIGDLMPDEDLKSCWTARSRKPSSTNYRIDGELR